MLNSLKMDFYRFFKSISLYIILGTIVVMVASVIYSFSIISDPAILETGIALPPDLMALMPQNADGYFDSIFQGNFLVLFSVIFTVIFANSEFKNGFIKNIATVVPNRLSMVFSKMLVFLAAIVMFHIITAICLVVGCFGILGLGEVVNPGGIVLTIVMSIFMNWTLAVFTYMLFMISRNAILPMITGVVYVLMGSMAYSLVDLLIEKICNINIFEIEKYTVMGNLLFFVNSRAEASTIIRALIVTIIVFGLSTGVSCVLMKKKDI